MSFLCCQRCVSINQKKLPRPLYIGSCHFIRIAGTQTKLIGSNTEATETWVVGNASMFAKVIIARVLAFFTPKGSGGCHQGSCLPPQAVGQPCAQIGQMMRLTFAPLMLNGGPCLLCRISIYDFAGLPPQTIVAFLKAGRPHHAIPYADVCSSVWYPRSPQEVVDTTICCDFLRSVWCQMSPEEFQSTAKILV